MRPNSQSNAMVPMESTERHGAESEWRRRNESFTEDSGVDVAFSLTRRFQVHCVCQTIPVDRSSKFRPQKPPGMRMDADHKVKSVD